MMTFTKELDDLVVCHFSFCVRITGNLFFDDGKVDAYNLRGTTSTFEMHPPTYSHDGCKTVEVWQDDEWTVVDGKLAELIYDAFCAAVDAERLAEEE